MKVVQMRVERLMTMVGKSMEGGAYRKLVLRSVQIDLLYLTTILISQLD